ncbi:MAG: alpha/beta fold hydrolase [Spirochaetes bacterium]|nr:alpha/beta fold hydrolase [Spirochaetota bacterium]
MIALAFAMLVAVYIVVVLIMSVVAYRGTFFPRFRSAEEALSACYERGDFDPSFLELPWEEFSVRSPRGFELKGSLLASGRVRAPTILLLHGITWNRYFALKFGKAFMAAGWNIAAVDLAGHGASAAPRPAYPSYGLGDKVDIAEVFAFLSSRFPESLAFGLAGESLGAAAALQYNALEPAAGVPKLSFIVADCPFSCIADEVVFQLQKRGLPRWIAVQAKTLVSIVSKRRRGFYLEEASCADAVLKARSPVLFIHGIEDRFVPTSMSIAMYNAMIKAGRPAELFLMPGAGHGKSWNTSPGTWEKVALDFAERAIVSSPIGLPDFTANPDFPLDKAY